MLKCNKLFQKVVMLQIKFKGNKAYTNMLANSLLLYLPLIPGMGVKSLICFVSESSHVAHQINWNEA